MNDLSEMTPLDVARVRADFPILARRVFDRPLVYLDNAASAQKPTQVLDAMRNFAETDYANVHRGLHTLSNNATQAYEAARARVAAFMGAPAPDDVIFTGGTTDSINLVAQSFLAPRIEAGDEIILSVMEHHSNIVPWHFLRERHGAVLKWIPVGDDGALDMDAYEAAFTDKTKMVALTHMSNVLGTLTPARRIVEIAHREGVPVMLDGAQAVVHGGVDVAALDCDFYAFSPHKIYGPNGIGALYGKAAHLADMRPYRGGGEMIKDVRLDGVSYGEPPHRFEAGTPPIIEAVGLAAALDYVETLGRAQISAHEDMLCETATRMLGEIAGVRIFGPLPQGSNVPKGSIISFVVEGVHPHDLATLLDRSGVAIRAGHHCAQPLMAHFGVTAMARASFAVYNTREEVEIFAAALVKAVDFFKSST